MPLVFPKAAFTIILTVNWPCWKRFASSGRKNSAKAPCRPLGNRISLPAKNSMRFWLLLTSWQSENPGFVMLLIQAAYCENGALMREKMKSCQLLSMQTALEGVLREGVESGDFFVDDVKTTAGLVLRLYMQFTDEIAFLLAGEENELQLCDKAIEKMRAYRTAIERMLFAPYGSIVLIESRNLQVLVQRVFRERLRKRADHLLNG